jgi:hypothetical protein
MTNLSGHDKEKQAEQLVLMMRKMMGVRSVALLAVLFLLASASTPGADAFASWWGGNGVPVSQLVDEGAEKMGEHLTQFFELCDRFLSFRSKRTFSSSIDDDEEATSRMSPFFVERVFHPAATKDSGGGRTKRAAANTTAHCSEPFGVSHPACDATYSCSISQAPPLPFRFSLLIYILLI